MPFVCQQFVELQKHLIAFKSKIPFNLQQQNMLNINSNKDFFLNARSQSFSTFKQPTKPSTQRFIIRPTLFIEETNKQTEFGQETKANIAINPHKNQKCLKTIHFNYKDSSTFRQNLQIANISKDFKEQHSRKMKELIQNIKATINIYKNMEKDQTIANRNLNYWFHELQQAFITAVGRQLKLESIQFPCKIGVAQIASDALEKQNYSISLLSKSRKIIPHQNSHQVNQLLQQLQFQKKMISEMLSIINHTRQYFESYKIKYTNSQKKYTTLRIQFQSYIDQIDQILEKINQKSNKQATTSLQRSIRQILIALKFKIYDATTKNL